MSTLEALSELATWPPPKRRLPPRAPGRNPVTDDRVDGAGSRSLLEEYLPLKYMSDGRMAARGRLASPGVLEASRVGAFEGASIFSALQQNEIPR